MDHRKSRILMFASLPLAFVFMLLALLFNPEPQPVLPVDDQGNISITFEVQRVGEDGRTHTVYLDENGNEVPPPQSDDSSGTDGIISLVLMGVAIVSLLGGQIQYLLFCRCPHCGGPLWKVRGPQVSYCPDCGEPL